MFGGNHYNIEMNGAFECNKNKVGLKPRRVEPRN
ncbi:hypothetical protein U728_2680 [Clostridium botulinum 202F]|nr:hypothetical protein U728_2680 [Clostridium botulinum 202F]